VYIPCFEIESNKDKYRRFKQLCQVEIKKEKDEDESFEKDKQKDDIEKSIKDIVYDNYQISEVHEVSEFYMKHDDLYDKNIQYPIDAKKDILIKNSFIMGIINFDVLNDCQLPSIYTKLVLKTAFKKA
jgi:hypothetical protein